MISLEKTQSCLLQLSVFLIPANLAYHWYISEAYSHGRLIDYLLPKFYLSDIPVISFIILSLIIHRDRHIRLLKQYSVIWLLLLLFFIYSFTRSALSLAPISSWWFDLKILEFTLFGILLTLSYTKKLLINHIQWPILLGLFFQTSLGFYQYINHSSLFGYFFLGEPNLEGTGITRELNHGILEVVPYGTTTHPNVLAGYICISLLLLMLGVHYSPNFKRNKTAYLLSIGLSFILLTIIRSWGAIFGLIISFSLFGLHKYVSSRVYKLIVLMYIASTLFLSPLLIHTIYHSINVSDIHSFSARYELNRQAISKFIQRPLFGVGPNQITLYLLQDTLPDQKTLFLQPPHHLGLLYLSEYGIVGVILLGLIITITLYIPGSRPHNHQNSLLFTIPFICILTIGSLDHYPLTIQTGQLLFTLASSLALNHR